jgi:hypothetical protein
LRSVKDESWNPPLTKNVKDGAASVADAGEIRSLGHLPKNNETTGTKMLISLQRSEFAVQLFFDRRR